MREVFYSLHYGFRDAFLTDCAQRRFYDRISARQRDIALKAENEQLATLYRELQQIGPCRDPRWKRTKTGWECKV